MGFLTDLLSLNARVFNLLTDVEKLNKRAKEMDETVQGMGREISEIRGMLAALHFSSSAPAQNNEAQILELQNKLSRLLERLEVTALPKD